MNMEFLAKLMGFYAANKDTIDRVKGDQYVQDAMARAKDLMKVLGHVWAMPDVKALYAAAKQEFDLGAEDKPVIDIEPGAHGANPLNAKGDAR
jgi:hypothetical protein